MRLGRGWTPYNNCTSLPTSLGVLKVSACTGVTAVESKTSCRQKEEGMTWRGVVGRFSWGQALRAALWESQLIGASGDSVTTAFN